MSDLIIKNKKANYLKVTPIALEQIKNLLSKRDTSLGIRVSLKTRGCSGMSYKIEYSEENVNFSEYDDLIEPEDGVRIFVDRKASLFMIGCTMDYEETDLKTGFVFNNPNVKEHCGCGSSFYA
jgi:iron-sulfur cluster assembly protein